MLSFARPAPLTGFTPGVPTPRRTAPHRARDALGRGARRARLASRRQLPPVQTASPTSAAAATVPDALVSACPVVVGGGPCGSLAAIMLRQRGVPVILVEQTPDFTDLNVCRSYPLGLTHRTYRVIQKIPALLDFLVEEAFTFTSPTVTAVYPDGGRKSFSLPKPIDAGLEFNLRFLRPGLLEGLKRYVLDECSDLVTAMYGTSVTGIHYGDDGEIQLQVLDADGAENTIRTRLVLACDGRNSDVVSELCRAAAEGKHTHIRNSNGFGGDAYCSPAVGLFVKSIVVNKGLVDEIMEPNPNNPTEGNPLKNIRVFKGKKVSRFPPFNLVAFSVGDKYEDLAGGLVATIVSPPEHPLWKLDSLDDAYRHFQETFPQIDVRKLISPDKMQQFISARPGKFPPAARRRSLVHDIGGPSSGGVVVLGDAAHSFPPDVGQGVNAASEDVDVLMAVFDGAPKDERIGEMLKQYEERRDSDTSSLVRICQIASPNQYGQNKLGLMLDQANDLFRGKLSQYLPNVFHPAMRRMLMQDLSYSEIQRRADETTRRLQALAVALGTAVVLAVFVAFF